MVWPASEPKQKEFLESFDRVDDQAMMVHDMLDIYKLETGMLGVWRREYEVADLVKPIRQILQRKAEMKNVRLELDLADNLPTVYCDGDKIGRVLINLTVNALKFAPPGSLVKIWSRYDAQQSKLLMGVTDQGPGISQDNLERIFTRFQQLEDTAPLNSKSFGLGLQYRVNCAAGAWRAYRAKRAGRSTFSFDLPPAVRGCSPARAARRTSAATRACGVHISGENKEQPSTRCIDCDR